MIVFDVTQEDIDNGDELSYSDNAIALAAKRYFKTNMVGVGLYTASVKGKHYDLDHHARKFVIDTVMVPIKVSPFSAGFIPIS